MMICSQYLQNNSPSPSVLLTHAFDEKFMKFLIYLFGLPWNFPNIHSLLYLFSSSTRFHFSLINKAINKRSNLLDRCMLASVPQRSALIEIKLYIFATMPTVEWERAWASLSFDSGVHYTHLRQWAMSRSNITSQKNLFSVQWIILSPLYSN